jgi:hypothetical protein
LLLSSASTLPTDWDNIDLTQLLTTLKDLNLKSPQFFGKAQLKIIYMSAGNKLTSFDVQRSIKLFAYGLKHYHNQPPYINMNSPAAILLETLKNGDEWVENRYLTDEEMALYKVYINLKKRIDDDLNRYFYRWLNIDKDKKFKFYKSKMGSTDYFDDRVFEEKAKKDFIDNIWPEEKKSAIIDILGLVDESVLNRFELISV